MAPHRRELLVAGGFGLALAGCSRKQHDVEAEEVTPVEDLMREHGVLRRIMLVYDETGRRLAADESVPMPELLDAARLVRKFVEDYHERIEEEHLFPRFERAKRLVELVAVLRRQHQVGRALTDEILAEPSPSRLAEVLRGFTRMYRAHAAREDTVLFPDLRDLVGARTYAELGEQFEELENEQLGPQGFERAVAEVAQIERAFGVEDLAKLTP